MAGLVKEEENRSVIGFHWIYKITKEKLTKSREQV